MSHSDHNSDNKPSVRAAFAGGGAVVVSTYREGAQVSAKRGQRQEPAPK